MDPCIVVRLSKNTNKMQLCNRIYYYKIYWRLNMFRAAYHSSSGASNCICSLWFIYCNKVKDFVYIIHFFLWRCDPTRVMTSFLRFLDHTQRRTTVGRTPLDEWSARRRDLYLTTLDTHNRQTSTPPGGIRTHDVSRQAAADLCLRPRGHWDRHILYIVHIDYV